MNKIKRVKFNYIDRSVPYRANILFDDLSKKEQFLFLKFFREWKDTRFLNLDLKLDGIPETEEKKYDVICPVSILLTI